MPPHANRKCDLRSSAPADLRVWAQTETPKHKKSTLRAHLTPINVTPINEGGHPDTCQSIEIKDFDEQGITFSHRLPLDGRRAMLVLENPQTGRLAIEVNLTWCQFNRTGRYTSGGRFVQFVGNTA